MTGGKSEMPLSESHFVLVARLSEVSLGRALLRAAGGVELLLCNVKHEIYAVENRCSHLSHRIGAGRLSGALLTCPAHGGQFDVRNGSAQCFPASRPIRTFEVRVEGDAVWVRLPRLEI